MEFLDFQVKLLKVVGIERFPDFLKKYVNWMLRTWNSFTIFALTAAAFNYALKSNDVLAICECLAPTFSAILILFKYLIFCIYTEDFFIAMEDVRCLNEKWCSMKDNKCDFQKVDKVATKFTKVFILMSYFVGGLFIMPFVLAIVKLHIYRVDSVSLRGFIADYNFDTTISPGYEITYFIETCMVYFTATFLATSTGLFVYFCLNIVAHFKIIRKIANEVKLDELVRYHLRVIKVTEKLTKLYRPIIFVEFAITAMILCTTGIQVVVSDSFIEIFKAIFHALTMLSDVAIYSYCSQIVMDSSQAVYKEIYKINRDYIPIILMSQKKLRFDTGLFEASLDTLSILLSRSCSLIMVLKSFVKYEE